MRWMLWVIAAAMVLAAGMGNAQGQSAGPPGPRYALVIGNAAYTAPGWRLQNPVNDARLMATRLRALGFQVTPVENATKAQMEAAMNGFTARLRAGGANAVGVFYYAGHGVEHDGANLLVPVDVTARSMDELRYQAPPMQFLLRDVARVGNAVNIIILDACRNLPLPSGSRSGPAGGLAELADVPTNVLIAYATRPGLTAPDNPGETNSTFTRVLAYALETNPNDTAVNLFSEVQAKVYEATDYKQRPEFRSGLLRAPTWRFASAAAPVASVDPELDRLRRENEALRRAGTAPRPQAATPTVAAPRPDAGGAAFAPGGVFRDCAECPEMVVIPSGSFVMGTPAGSDARYAEERPQRTVRVRSFAVSKFETTFAQWDACVAGGGCGGYRPDDEGWGRGTMPVMRVSWDDAQSYVTWINAPGRGDGRYRLLSESEWEYAARGRVNGTANDTPYPWGPVASREHANYGTESKWCCEGAAAGSDRWINTSPVGSFPANPFGLHDMHGNVREWVQDCWVPDHKNAPRNQSARETGVCDNRVMRGGSWASYPHYMRSAYRHPEAPSTNYHTFHGFRVAKSL